jgi:demethylmenaquinone methyltransferase/2-methoxy-6-polyprenyl-1,4-benzoquinol methylase
LLDVPLKPRDIQAFYGAASRAYDDATAQYEARAKALAMEAVDRREGETYLEVAVGTGLSIVEQVRRTGPAGVVGVDLTPEMLALARERLAGAGGGAVPLLLADARCLPFCAGAFDWLFNSYMLDLIPTGDLPVVIREFRRVLKPGGRIVLANLTEGEGDDAAFSESWKAAYSQDPARLGGCRPVLAGSFLEAGGFASVRRVYCGGSGAWPTEVVTARAAS